MFAVNPLINSTMGFGPKYKLPKCATCEKSIRCSKTFIKTIKKPLVKS